MRSDVQTVSSFDFKLTEKCFRIILPHFKYPFCKKYFKTQRKLENDLQLVLPRSDAIPVLL